MSKPVKGTERAAAGKGPVVVVAGGGTAGHIEPALALADAVMRLRPDATVIALGTERGLENKLVPARGYALELIPPVPLPRKPTPELLRLPLKVRDSVRKTREVLDRVGADVVVGFGGYVALPAYLAARGRVPIVVHEANQSAGPGEQGRRAVRQARRGRRPGHAAAEGRGRRDPAAAVDHVARPRRRCGPRPARTSGWTRTRRRCWCSAARRARSRSTPRCPARPRTWPTPGSACCTRTARRTRWSCRSSRASRRTCRCRTWSGWTWPTPRRTSRSAARAR